VTARILVTGSRAWSSTLQMRRVIRAALDELGADATIVHGNAQGADRLAALIAGGWGATPEKHDADWTGPCRAECNHGPRPKRYGRSYCPAAGDYRNQLMVDLGADVCLVFLVPPSVSPCKGSRDCRARAKAAKIPIRDYEQGDVA
jgi:hypothetical protein